MSISNARPFVAVDQLTPGLRAVRELLASYNPRGRSALVKGEIAMSQGNDQATASREYAGSNGSAPFLDRARKPMFDFSVNLPTLLMMLGMCITSIGFVFGVYSSLDKRILELEASDKQQELHFQRIEISQADSRSEVRQSIDKLGDKIDKLNDKFSFNGAGNRPETSRWTRNN
jgi:hypothetical protein